MKIVLTVDPARIQARASVVYIQLCQRWKRDMLGWSEMEGPTVAWRLAWTREVRNAADALTVKMGRGQGRS